MTKEELISSFPEYSFDMTPWIVWPIVIGVVLALLALIIFRDDFEIGIRAAVIIGGTVILGGMSLGAITEFGSKIAYEETKFDWRRSEFYLKYLPTVEEERFKVLNYTLNSNGTVTALVDTDYPEKTVTYIANVHYYAENQNQQGAYIKARWVDGLDDYEVLTGFYDVNIYVPVEEVTP